MNAKRLHGYMISRIFPLKWNVTDENLSKVISFYHKLEFEDDDENLTDISPKTKSIINRNADYIENTFNRFDIVSRGDLVKKMKKGKKLYLSFDGRYINKINPLHGVSFRLGVILPLEYITKDDEQIYFKLYSDYTFKSPVKDESGDEQFVYITFTELYDRMPYENRNKNVFGIASHVKIAIVNESLPDLKPDVDTTRMTLLKFRKALDTESRSSFGESTANKRLDVLHDNMLTVPSRLGRFSKIFQWFRKGSRPKNTKTADGDLIVPLLAGDDEDSDADADAGDGKLPVSTDDTSENPHASGSTSRQHLRKTRKRRQSRRNKTSRRGLKSSKHYR